MLFQNRIRVQEKAYSVSDPIRQLITSLGAANDKGRCTHFCGSTRRKREVPFVEEQHSQHLKRIEPSNYAE